MKHPAFLTLGGIAFVVALAAAPIVSAAQPAPAPTMVPMSKPDFSSMAFLVGTWNCTQPLRGKTRPDTTVNTMSPDGMWMLSKDTAPPFDQYRTVTVESTGYTGYDPTVKQWVQLGVDNTGGYGWGSSPGWQGNTITWTGKNLDGSTTTDVITKTSDTETSDVNTTVDAQGKTTNTVTITCKKAG